MDNTSTNADGGQASVVVPGAQYAIVEIMGHDRISGRISEETIAGVAMLAVDVAEIPPIEAEQETISDRMAYVQAAFPGRPAFRKLFGGSAIFSIRFCTAEESLADELRRVPRGGRTVTDITPRLLGSMDDDLEDPLQQGATDVDEELVS